MQECQRLGIMDVDIDDIYLGNGVSELITLSMQALLNNGDEVLIPAPDYPSGPQPCRSAAVDPFIITATKLIGFQTSLTLKRK